MSEPTTTTPADPSSLLKRPKRADARRNYDKLLAAAREAFQQDGPDASLEDIARRADVGIGTLYRNFPTRQALLEAAYVQEVEAMARRASDVADLPPWDALVTWLERFVDYAATKRVIGEALVAYLDDDAPVLQLCRAALSNAGEPLVKRAQDAGVVRQDTNFIDIARMVGGIATIRNADQAQIDRIMAMALDGIRPAA